MTPRTPNTRRPTDAAIAKVLREMTDRFQPHFPHALHYEEETDMANEAYAIADALEAASAEPRTYGDGEARYATPEAAATDSVSVRETFDEYDYVRYASYKGATRRDVIRAVLRSVGMETQEPHLVTTDDEAASLHRPDCSPDCSTHHRMTNEAPYDDDSYTVSGVDYFFTEGR